MTKETAALLKPGTPEHAEIVSRFENEIGTARSGFQVMKAKISYKKDKRHPHEALLLMNYRDNGMTFVCTVRWTKATGVFLVPGMKVITADDKVFKISNRIKTNVASMLAKELVRLKGLALKHVRGNIKVTASTVSSVKQSLEKFKFTVTVEGDLLSAVHQSGDHIKVSMKPIKKEDENGEEQVYYKMAMNSPLFPGAPEKYFLNVVVEDRSPSGAFDLWYPAAVEAFNKTKKAWAKDVNGDIGRGYYWLSGFFAGRIMKNKKGEKGKKGKPFTSRRNRSRRNAKASSETAASGSLKRFGEGVYFHLTPTHHAVSIVQGNKLVLSPTMANPSEQRNASDKYSFYASFARTPESAFFRYIRGAVIVFDARKLKAKYEIKPTDYYERMWLRAREVTLGPDKNQTRESEDRLFSSKPIIPLPKGSIKEIHAYYLRASNNQSIADLPKLVSACKKLKIPIYVHRNEETVRKLSLKKSDHVPISEIIESERERSKKARENPDYYHRSGGYDRTLKAILNVYHAKKYSDLTKETMSTCKWWSPSQIASQDFANGLAADFHNSKSIGDAKTKNRVAKIIAIMRKHKFDFKSLYEHIYSKYRGFSDEYYAEEQRKYEAQRGKT
jgi:hypothetical protein